MSASCITLPGSPSANCQFALISLPAKFDSTSPLHHNKNSEGLAPLAQTVSFRHSLQKTPESSEQCEREDLNLQDLVSRTRMSASCITFAKVPAKGVEPPETSF